MQLLTARDVIAELGGTQGVSTLTGSKPGAISNWRTGNWFPTKFHLLMTSALERRGYTAPASLWRVPEYD